MPTEAIPYVVAVVALFGTFMAVVGSVSIWSKLPVSRR